MNCSNPLTYFVIRDMEAKPANNYDAQTYQYWKNQIDAANKYREKFVRKGENIIKRYRDEDRVSDYERRYNILYSNTETLLPVVYSNRPKPEVTARDSKVIATRKAGEMIEKAIEYYLSCGNFNETARLSVTDFLLSGLGTIRPKYEPLIEEIEEEISITDVSPDDKVREDNGVFYRSVERVAYEEIEYEYVHWKDFIYPEAICWEELPWVAYRSYYTQSEAAELIGAEKAKLLKYQPYKIETDKSLEDMQALTEDKAEIYEIWDEESKQQIFWAETVSLAPLEINDDPLGLEGFFPSPKPMFSITTSGTLLPVPFFIMYQDQAMELDDINSRISAMIDNMKRRGFYDASIGELTNIASMGDNEFWPVKNWADFSGKGGLGGAMQVEDITSYASILVVLTEKRTQLLDDIYQIIGISDIRRGQTDPRETLGAQQMKGRYGTIRISTYQRKVAEFMRDLLRITGEIIINQFEPETLAVITNMPLKTKITKDEENNIIKADVGVVDLLKSLREKSPSDIVIDIQTDSTITEDSEGDKAQLLEVTSALAEFVGIADPMAGVIGIDATANLLLSIVQRFKLGRNIQQEVQDHIDDMKTQAEAAKGQPPKPTPEEILAQAEIEKTRMKYEFETQQLMVKSKLEMAALGIKQQVNTLKAAELGVTQEMKQQEIDLKAIDGMMKFEAIKAEAANKTDNAVVGA